MTQEVANIGAGIAGLTLALSLHDQGISCTIYESRPAPLNIGGAVMLSPNALKIFDEHGIYSQLKSKGYSFDTLYFRTVAGEDKGTYEFGSQEKYGYSGLRVYRYQLIDSLLDKIKEKGISLNFGRKYSHVVEETDDHVTWQFADGSTGTASLLIGADGIHSRVRRYIFPDLEPRFTGMAGIAATVPTSQIRLPSPDYELPVTIMHPTLGAFVIAPQSQDSSEVFFGKMKRISEPSRKGWEEIHADTDASIAFLRENVEAWGDLAASTTTDIPTSTINVWPFYIIPRLQSWESEKRRVVLVGDSAHAVPPSSGQGINQAVEDVHMLALLLGQGRGEAKDLAFWQEYRQGRIDEILKLNARIDKR